MQVSGAGFWIIVCIQDWLASGGRIAMIVQPAAVPVPAAIWLSRTIYIPSRFSRYRELSGHTGGLHRRSDAGTATKKPLLWL